MDLGLKGRCAAVAAASKGLGFGAAAALVEEGVAVAICSRDEGRIKDAAQRLGSRGSRGKGGVPVVALVADVSTPDGATGFVRQAQEALGRVDILVANAGGPPPGRFSTTDLEAYQYALNLNLLSTVAMCRQAVPPMQEQQWGRVVAITSIGVRQPILNLAASSTARAGVTSFLKVLAGEVAGDGVTVNSVQPGIHATDRIKSLGSVEEVARGVPTGVLGTAEDFGKVVAFLASEPARFITGTSLLVDGGAYPGLI